MFEGKWNVALVLAAAALVYLIWVQPKAKLEIGAVQQGENVLNEGLAAANKLYGSVTNLFA